MKKRYEVLLMDVDGTLLDFDKAEREGFKQVLEHYDFTPEEALIEEYHLINKECWEALEEGKISRDEVLTSRFEKFFSRHNCAVNGQEAENLYRLYLEKGFYLIDGAVSILEYLKDRYRLYVVTNGVAETQRLRLEGASLNSYFKDVFISEDAGSQKPKKEFFDYCFARIPEADPAKMLIIGDSLTSDIRGGINAGVDTCWFNPKGIENKRGIMPGYEIKSLSELKEML